MTGARPRADAAYHSFDARVAVAVGSVNAAVVYSNIVFWVRHNETNRRNYHEGRYWTYNSLAAFDEQFPYLTPKQIRTALNKLVDAGLIVKGNFAEDRFKRANWYALGETICPNGRMEEPDGADATLAQEGEASAPQGKCIENRYKPDSKPYPSEGPYAVSEVEIEAVWAAYPQDRRRARTSCKRQLATTLREISLDELVAAAKDYDTESRDFSRSMVSFIDNWLRDGRWRRHLDERKAAADEKDAAMRRSLVQVAGWIKASSPICRRLTRPQIEAVVDLGMVTPAEMQLAGVAI